MNRVILMGRLTRDPEVRWTQGQDQKCMARYTLAVDRRGRRAGEQQADFIPCVAFGKAGEFAEKYFRQGQRVLISGRIHTGNYVNRDGNKVYTTDVVIDEQEFADSKRDGSGVSEARKRDMENARNARGAAEQGSWQQEGFMDIPDGVEDDGLPFN